MPLRTRSWNASTSSTANSVASGRFGGMSTPTGRKISCIRFQFGSSSGPWLTDWYIAEMIASTEEPSGRTPPMP